MGVVVTVPTCGMLDGRLELGSKVRVGVENGELSVRGWRATGLNRSLREKLENGDTCFSEKE